MAKNRNPNRDKAYELFKNNTSLTPKQLAEILNEKVTNIRSWKSQDNWMEKLGLKKKKRGAPKGNTNSLGNKGGAPEGNLNAFKTGERISPERFNSKKFLAKYLPKVTESIIDELHGSNITTLDTLWMSIQLQIAAIIRSQKIMHVTSKNEIKKSLKSKEVAPGKWGDKEREEYEVQFAWDRQERFVAVQSKAIKTLSDLIKNYEDLLHKDWDMATEEQKARIEVLKSKINNDTSNREDKIDKYFEALEGVFKND